MNFNKVLVNYFGRKPLNAITPDAMEFYREHRKSQGISDRTVDIEISYLSKMFNMAVKRKKIPRSILPGEFVKTSKKELHEVSPPRRLITEPEYEKILEVAKTDFRDICICAYETSMRAKEIAELRAKPVHVDRVVSEVPYRVANYLEVRNRIANAIEGEYPGIYFFSNLKHFWRTVPDLQLDERDPEKGWDTNQEDHICESSEIAESTGSILDDLDDAVEAFGDGVGKAGADESQYTGIVSAQGVDELAQGIQTTSEG